MKTRILFAPIWRRFVPTAALTLLTVGVPVVFPVYSPMVYAQATMQGTENFVRQQVIPGKVSARQLRMVWQFLREGRVYDFADNAPPLKSEEEQLVRRLAAQFEALALYDKPNTKEQPPAIQAGDLLVQMFKWDETGGIIAMKSYDAPTLSGSALLYIEKDGQVVERDLFSLSLSPQEAAERPLRPGLLWLRPKTATIAFNTQTPTGAQTPTGNPETQVRAVVSTFFDNLSHRRAASNLSFFLRPDASVVGVPAGEGTGKIWQKRADVWLSESQRELENLGADTAHFIESVQVHNDAGVVIARVSLLTPYVRSQNVFVFTTEGTAPKITSLTAQTRSR